MEFHRESFHESYRLIALSVVKLFLSDVVFFKLVRRHSQHDFAPGSIVVGIDFFEVVNNFR